MRFLMILNQYRMDFQHVSRKNFYRLQGSIRQYCAITLNFEIELEAKQAFKEGSLK